MVRYVANEVGFSTYVEAGLAMSFEDSQPLARKAIKSIIGYCSQHCGLASHTTYVVRDNSMYEWLDLQFKVDYERHIFEKLFHGRFIYSLRAFARKLLRGMSRKSTFSYFVFIWSCLI